MFVQQIWQLKPIHPLTDARPAARVVGHDGLPITQASLSTITYQVFDTGTEELTGSGSVTIATSVFDTLQTNSIDPRWPGVGAQYADGYNFAHTVPGSAFPEGARTYEVQYTLTPSAGGSAFIFAARVNTTHPIGT